MQDNLRNKWHLFIEGDENNLPKILKKIKNIDLFSYDSDKTYAGKLKTFKEVYKYLTENSVVILDDIQDDSFFYDFIQKNNISNWKLFEFQNKYFGVIGDLILQEN